MPNQETAARLAAAVIRGVYSGEPLSLSTETEKAADAAVEMYKAILKKLDTPDKEVPAKDKPLKDIFRG